MATGVAPCTGNAYVPPITVANEPEPSTAPAVAVKHAGSSSSSGGMAAISRERGSKGCGGGGDGGGECADDAGAKGGAAGDGDSPVVTTGMEFPPTVAPLFIYDVVFDI